jgi:hypothetical protein
MLGDVHNDVAARVRAGVQHIDVVGTEAPSVPGDTDDVDSLARAVVDRLDGSW